MRPPCTHSHGKAWLQSRFPAHNRGPMNKPLLLLILGAAAAASGCRTTLTAIAPDLQEVEAVERARFQAWVRADTDAMRPMLADDLLYCHSDGRCENKEQVLSSIGSRQAIYESIDVLELKPRALGGAALINGKVRMRVQLNGNPLEFTAIYTDAYVKRDGRWQLVSWQSTRLP